MPDTTYQPLVYREQGGSRQVVASGGSLDIESGGEIDIESGGSLKLAGTAVTATAAKLNAAATKSGGTAYETVAAAGSTKDDAAAMVADFVLVSAADGTKGVKLPAGVAGKIMFIKNNANAVLKIWPPAGGQINAVGADTAMSIAAFTGAVLAASSATQWFTIPLLPS